MAPVVTDPFNRPDAASLAAAYEAMNPELYADATTTTLRAVERLQQEQARARSAWDGRLLAMNGSAAETGRLLGPHQVQGNPGLWINLFGEQGDQEGGQETTATTTRPGESPWGTTASWAPTRWPGSAWGTRRCT